MSLIFNNRQKPLETKKSFLGLNISLGQNLLGGKVVLMPVYHQWEDGLICGTKTCLYIFKKKLSIISTATVIEERKSIPLD